MTENALFPELCKDCSDIGISWRKKTKQNKNKQLFEKDRAYLRKHEYVIFASSRTSRGELMSGPVAC